MTAVAAAAGSISGAPSGGEGAALVDREPHEAREVQEARDVQAVDAPPGESTLALAGEPFPVSPSLGPGAGALGPGRWPPPGRWTPSLAQSLCIAAVLHALLVWVVGSSPPGTALPGEGRFGSINVRLRGPLGAQPGETTGTSAESYTGPKGQARNLRWGGAVREAALPPPDPTTPGAAREGTWNPNRTGRLDGPETDASPAAATTGPSTEGAPTSSGEVPVAPSSTQVAAASPPRPLTDSSALAADPVLTRPAPPEEPAMPNPLRAAPPSVPVLSAPTVPLPSIASLVLPPIHAEPDAPVVPLLAERPVRHSDASRTLPRPTLGPSLVAPALPSVDVAPTPAPEPAALPPLAARPLRPLTPLTRSPEPLSSAATRALPLPVIREAPPEPPVLPMLAVRPAREAAPLAPLPVPTPELTQAMPLPSIVAAVPAPPASAAASTQRQPAIAPPPPAEPVAASPVAAPTASAERPLPSAVAPTLPAQAAATGGPASAPALAGPAPASPAPVTAGGAQARPAGPPVPPEQALAAPVAGGRAEGLPAVTPQAAGAAAPGAGRPSSGAPDAGLRVGHDVATAPSAPASAPRLNLDLPRSSAGPLSSQSTKGLLQLMPRPPETRTRLEKEIEKAARPDCKQAYAGAGLLAVVPLVLDAARDKGCKW